MALTELAASLASNPYFSAGFGLFGVGTVAALGRGVAQISIALGKRHMVSSVQVPCNDKAYTWFLDWLGRKAGSRAQHVSVRTEWVEEEGGRISSHYSVEPSPGVHLLKWKGAWIKLDRVREQQQGEFPGKPSLLRHWAGGNICCFKCLMRPEVMSLPGMKEPLQCIFAQEEGGAKWDVALNLQGPSVL